MQESHRIKYFEFLRKKTYKRLKKKTLESGSSATEEEILKLIYEMESLQLKQELQNKELIRANART